MKRRVSAHLENWLALIPFRISRKSWDDFPCVVCELGQDGHIGRGESLGVYYLDDTERSMLAQIDSVAGQLAAGAGRPELLDLLPPGGARCAVDAALWDLEAQLSGTSAWAAAGVTTDPIETVFTIGLEAEPEDMGARAAAARDLTLFKVKLNNDRPVERIAAIRKARPDARLVVDVNEGWDLAQLKEVAPRLAGLGVSMIEQPLPRGHDQVLEDYDSPLPLCADESCQHAGELEHIARRYQMINIKLDKCGGLTHGLELAAAARSLGLGIMVGCMGGTSLSMAPMHVLAHTADFVDIDGPLLLKNDRLGGFIYDRGMVSLPDKPFWGQKRAL
jgi:L-alanine-DL-glutamate epimerase-like enolase superfamily enzyme